MSKILCVLLLALSAPVPEPIYHVYIATNVQAGLGRVADSATVEHVRCLIGAVFPDDSVPSDTTIAIDDAVPPLGEQSGPLTVNASCTAATLIAWHNHIFAATKKAWKGRMDVVEPRDACGLSSLDFVSALAPHAPRIQVVQVNMRTFCWFTKHQLQAFRNRLGEVAVPIWLPATESQLRTDWGDDPRERE